jgi:hypothetical protein
MIVAHESTYIRTEGAIRVYWGLLIPNICLASLPSSNRRTSIINEKI